jgi:hypothetical protein
LPATIDHAVHIDQETEHQGTSPRTMKWSVVRRPRSASNKTPAREGADGPTGVGRQQDPLRTTCRARPVAALGPQQADNHYGFVATLLPTEPSLADPVRVSGLPQKPALPTNRGQHRRPSDRWRMILKTDERMSQESKGEPGCVRASTNLRMPIGG